MTLLERNEGIVARCNYLQPLVGPIQRLLTEGKRLQLLSADDATGQPFAPLAPSTLQHRFGVGPPLIPQGESSELIRGYNVEVTAEPDRLLIHAGWPSNPWVGYHISGTRKMPRRDPSGFRQEDMRAGLEMLRAYVMKGY